MDLVSSTNVICDQLHISFEAIKHLSKNSHEKSLESFWGETGAYIIKDQLKLTKAKYLVASQSYREV